MTLVDLHCDTLTKMLQWNEGFSENGFAVDLKKAGNLCRYAQVFAAFIPDTMTPEQGWRYYEQLLDTFRTRLAQTPQMGQARTAREIKALWCHGKRAAVLSVENGALIGTDLEKLDRLCCDGVRFFTLTWNGDNAIAGGIQGSGGGLTAFGRKVVERLCRLNIFPDVSHLSERGFYDVASCTSKPLVATHSNLRSVHRHKRNLTDEQFRMIVQTGGVAGINFYTEFLGKNAMDSVYRNLDRMLCLGGENNIAVGSDFDGAEIDISLSSIDKVADLCDYLIGRGIAESVIQKVMYKNAVRLLGEDPNEVLFYKKKDC